MLEVKSLVKILPLRMLKILLIKLTFLINNLFNKEMLHQEIKHNKLISLIINRL